MVWPRRGRRSGSHEVWIVVGETVCLEVWGEVGSRLCMVLRGSVSTAWERWVEMDRGSRPPSREDTALHDLRRPCKREARKRSCGHVVMDNFQRGVSR
jgi:hypothetical protein